MRSLQAGLGTFGVLVVLVIAGFGGWWVYKNVFEADTASASCESQQSTCVANCRKTSTDSAQLQACQDGCRRNFSSCQSEKR